MTRYFGEPIGEIVGIYVSPARGQPMRSLDRVLAIKHEGLEGDRYNLKIARGTYSGAQPTTRDVTLIDEGALGGFKAQDTRRNVVVRLEEEWQLPQFTKLRVLVGGAILNGIELCPPCRVPEKVYGVEGFYDAFLPEGKGGVRMGVELGGLLRVGDQIVALGELAAIRA